MISDWSDVAYRLDEIVDPRITRVREAICRTFRNGGMLIQCFCPTLSTDPALPFRGIDSIRRFVECPAIARLVPELRPKRPLPDDFGYVSLGRYAFEGEIIQLLLARGAYCDSEFDVPSARIAAADFVDAIAGNVDPAIFRIDSSWAEWFEGIEANRITFVIYTHRKWWLICTYDTD